MRKVYVVFTTIVGGVMAGYVSLKECLICQLWYSFRLFIPETKKPKTLGYVSGIYWCDGSLTAKLNLHSYV